MNQNIIKIQVIIKRDVCILITLCLVGVVYWSYQKSTAAVAELEKAQTAHKEAEEEEAYWVALESHFKELDGEFREQTRKIARGFHSFRSAELLDARKKVLAGAEVRKAIFSASTPGAIWVPESGHHVEFLFQVKNFDEDDLAKGEFHLPERLRFDLKPRQLHSFHFSLKDEDDSKGRCLLRFEFDEESHIDMVLRGEWPRSSYPGNEHFQLARTRLFDGYADLKQTYRNEAVRRGAWHFLPPTTYTLARKVGEPLEITCHPIIFHADNYAVKGWSLLLKKANVSFTEVVDPDSPWFGFLKIDSAPDESQSP